MDSAWLFLGSGQLVLALALAYFLHLFRRDARRAALVALVAILNELRDRNIKALLAALALMASEDFQRSDGEVRAGLVDCLNRLRAIHAALTEALLQSLHDCDTEWHLAGRLHGALRSQLDDTADRHWDRVIAHYGAPIKGCA